MYALIKNIFGVICDEIYSIIQLTTVGTPPSSSLPTPIFFLLFFTFL